VKLLLAIGRVAGRDKGNVWGGFCTVAGIERRRVGDLAAAGTEF
jgi:hypothetical protein